MSASDAVTLSVVMPAYNEAAVVDQVVRDHLKTIVDAFPRGQAELIVVDDASTDETPAILDRLAAEDEAIRVIHLDCNGGHGPALIRAIDEAEGDWVLHVDSDGQTDPADFPALWAARSSADLVLGIRVERHDPRHRLLMTRVVRLVASLAAGRTLVDANIPFKLIRRSLWTDLRPDMSADTFAPSVLIAVGAVRWGRRIAEVPVTHRARPHGSSTLRPVKLGRILWRCGRELLGFRARLAGAQRFSRRHHELFATGLLRRTPPQVASR